MGYLNEKTITHQQRKERLLRKQEKERKKNNPRIDGRTKAWVHMQKRFRGRDIPTPEEIYSTAESIKDSDVQALFIILYLTAGRISEVIGLYGRDIKLVEKKGRQIMKFNMPNEKHRSRYRKDIPIPKDREFEKAMLANIKTYRKLIQPDQKLFDMTRIAGYKKIQKATGWNPHYLRHVRLTHLVTVYDFNEQLLVMFAGWTDSRPAKNYMSLKWGDILQKM